MVSGSWAISLKYSDSDSFCFVPMKFKNVEQLLAVMDDYGMRGKTMEWEDFFVADYENQILGAEPLKGMTVSAVIDKEYACNPVVKENALDLMRRHFFTE